MHIQQKTVQSGWIIACLLLAWFAFAGQDQGHAMEIYVSVDGNACSEYRLYSDAADTWTDDDTTYSDNIYAAVFRWRTAFQHDFQARMDWCVKPPDQANHPPIPVCNGPQIQNVTAGSVVERGADGSSDPDRDALSYRWIYYPEAGTYKGSITIRHADRPNAKFSIPTATPGTKVHIILVVTDQGVPPLTRYQRRIFNIVD